MNSHLLAITACRLPADHVTPLMKWGSHALEIGDAQQAQEAARSLTVPMWRLQQAILIARHKGATDRAIGAPVRVLRDAEAMCQRLRALVAAHLALHRPTAA